MDSDMLTALTDLAWMHGPTLLMVAGAAMVLHATRYVAAAVRSAEPRRVLYIARSFRLALVGLACLGVGVGWRWEMGSLVGLSLIIGGEELLETTVVIQALKDGVRRRQRAGASALPAPGTG